MSSTEFTPEYGGSLADGWDPSPSPSPESRRRRRRFLIVPILLLLLTSVSLWTYYLITRQPVTKVLPANLPGGQLVELAKPRYLFSVYEVREPVGVGVSAAGDRIYVAESGGERMLRAFDRDGKPLFGFAAPNSQVPTRSSVYIFVDSTGVVYVTDRGRHSIDTYDAGGNFRGSVKAPFPEGWSPLGIRVDGDDILATDVTEQKHRVVRLDKGGKVKLQFGKEGRGESSEDLWFPNSAVADERGRIYVSDSNNARVQVFDDAGKLLYSLTGFGLPRGLTMDGDGRLYVVDAVNHNVRVFDTKGEKAQPLFSFGDYGVGDGELNYPNDIAIDDTGRLYLTDRVNNRVQVWGY